METYRVDIHFAPEGERKPVPFELIHGHLLFKARIEGQEVWAMLDNGVGLTAVDTGYARSHGLKVGPRLGQVITATGSLELGRVLNVGIEIPGQMAFRAPVVAAIDFSSLSTYLGRPIALVIGKEKFDVLSFFIAPSDRTFQLGASGTLNVPSNTPYLVLKDDRPQLDISIAGRPAVVTVDLGDDSMITLTDAAWARLGLNRLPAVEGKSVRADGRIASTRSAVVDEVSIGPINARRLSVIAGPVVPGSGDGAIGMGFFSGFNFAIDVKARRIWLISPVGSNPAEIGNEAERAVRLYKSGQKAEGERQLAQLRARVTSAEDLNTLCWAKATAGILLESAVRDCREAVRLSNGSAAHVDSLGMALLQSGKLDEALAAYTQAIDKAHPAASYMGRALVYARKGDALQAQADLAEARKRDPNIEKTFAELGLRLDTAR